MLRISLQRCAQHDNGFGRVTRYFLRVKLTFLGTRGEIDARTRRHRMHTSLLVSYRSANVIIDCGLDWLGKLKRVSPRAIVLTHAHPDHAWGLKQGAPCAVYPIKDRHVIKERKPTKICGITFDAFPVEHSILSPAVGYRVSAGRVHFLRAGPHLHSRAQCSAQGRANLYWRWRHGHALVYSQTRQSVNRSLACSDATDMVRERMRAARHHHTLRI